eukprot:scaffold148552_cov27-Tisochrysis_lutea.AAC.2
MGRGPVRDLKEEGDLKHRVRDGGLIWLLDEEERGGRPRPHQADEGLRLARAHHEIVRWSLQLDLHARGRLMDWGERADSKVGGEEREGRGRASIGAKSCRLGAPRRLLP